LPSPSPLSRARTTPDKAEFIYPLKSRNYQVSAAVGVSPAILSPTRDIPDTGAGLNLVRSNLLPDDWERLRVHTAPSLPIVGAGGRRLRQKGTVTIFVELGKLRVKAQFLVVEGLATECILGCQFIKRHVDAILPKEKIVRLSDASVIQILKDSDPLLPLEERVKPPEGTSTKIRASKFT
jgi:Retroviral aspartyl protease